MEIELVTEKNVGFVRISFPFFQLNYRNYDLKKEERENIEKVPGIRNY